MNKILFGKIPFLGGNVTRVVVFSLLLLISAIGYNMTVPVDINCEQCGVKFWEEPVMARIVSNYSGGFFCSVDCHSEWCSQHPIELDKDGKIVNKSECYWRQPPKKDNVILEIFD